MKHNKEKPTTVSVDIGLFLYLQEKVCERKTKTEAYCNLLKKASENFVSPILKNRNQELNINQCHVTITDLSVEWHWHRSTVRSFLETLEEYGQIEIIRLPKSFLITMPVGINGTADTTDTEYFGLTYKLQTVLSNWESDNMSTLEAGEKCMNLLKEDIKKFIKHNRRMLLVVFNMPKKPILRLQSSSIWKVWLWRHTAKSSVVQQTVQQMQWFSSTTMTLTVTLLLF